MSLGSPRLVRIEPAFQSLAGEDMINDLGYRVSRFGRAVSKLGVIGSALASAAAWAVNDLPGGPGVKQLDLPPAAPRLLLRSLTFTT